MIGPCAVPTNQVMPHVEVRKLRGYPHQVIVIVDAGNLGTLPKGDSWIFCTNGERKGLLVKFGSGIDDVVWYGGLSSKLTVIPASLKGKLLKHPQLSIEQTEEQKLGNDITDLVNKLIEVTKESK